MAKGKKSNKLQNKSHINGHNKNLTKLFQVKTADKTVSVEKEILKKHMCYFQLIFEKDKSAIYHELPHKIYSQYFINILEFLKKVEDGITISNGTVLGYLDASLFLGVAQVYDICFNFLLSTSYEEGIPAYVFAKKYNHEGWKASAQKHMMENFPLLCRQERLFDLQFEDFAAILQSNELNASETLVYLAAKKWLQQIPSRASYADEILGLVRFSQINKELLNHRLMQDSFMKNHTSLIKEVFDVN